ncbi:Trm112 family protein [Microlunatus elymi]
MAVELAPELLAVLACPNCHGSLAVDHERSELVCTSPDCQLAYPVRDQIPILLIDEARPPKGAPSSSRNEGRPDQSAEQPDRGPEPGEGPNSQPDKDSQDSSKGPEPVEGPESQSSKGPEPVEGSESGPSSNTGGAA